MIEFDRHFFRNLERQLNRGISEEPYLLNDALLELNIRDQRKARNKKSLREAISPACAAGMLFVILGVAVYDRMVNREAQTKLIKPSATYLEAVPSQNEAIIVFDGLEQRSNIGDIQTAKFVKDQDGNITLNSVYRSRAEGVR